MSDHDDIQNMVQEVLIRLAACQVDRDARGTVVVVCTGATVGADMAVVEIQNLILRGFTVQLCCSAAARHLVGAKLQDGLCGFPGWQWLDDGHWFSALHAAQAVVVPLLSVSALSKLAALIADTDSENLMLHALCMGKPLLLARNGVASGSGRAALGLDAGNSALRQAIENRLHQVVVLGATVTALDGLAARAVSVCAPLVWDGARGVGQPDRTVFYAEKRVIAGGDVMEAQRRGGDLSCPPDAVITPLAQETADRHGVRIVRGYTN